MDKNVETIFLKSKAKHGFDILVNGTSMQPYLQENDIIRIMTQDEYFIGDIILFKYKYNELIVHRILKIDDNRYFCKGDNSFRLEDIVYDQIIGKVILCNKMKILPLSDELIDLSYDVHCIFRQNGYSKNITIKSDKYLKYKRMITQFVEKNKFKE